MGGTVRRKQARAVDAGIDLGRRQRGVAEQVLDRAQIASPSQKMGGERMAERVRRRGLGQAERAAHPRHRQLHDARRQWAAFRADEQRAGGLEGKRAKRQIILDRLAHGRDDRRRARLLAFADDRDGVRFADRRVGASDRERLRDAQARAIAERQHRGVARQHPGFARLAVTQRCRGHGFGVLRAQWSGQAPRGLGRTDSAERRGCLSAFARDMAGERFERRERALQRAALDPFGSPVGEKGAQIAWRAIGEIADAWRRAEALCEEGEKLPGVAAIGLDRARRQAALVGEMAKPGDRRRGEIGRGGE